MLRADAPPKLDRKHVRSVHSVSTDLRIRDREAHQKAPEVDCRRRAWIAFRDVERFPHSTLCFIYDTLRHIGQSRPGGIEFHDTCRIFVCGSERFLESAEVPRQLRSLLKPIALAAPDYRILSMTKLAVLGFSAIKSLPNQLVSILCTFLHIFPYIHQPSMMTHIMSILPLARRVMEQVMHTDRVKFLNYYEETRTTEQYSLARAIYLHFAAELEPEHVDSMLTILYSVLPVFGDKETLWSASPIRSASTSTMRTT
jgi:hypothetical protein